MKRRAGSLASLREVPAQSWLSVQKLCNDLGEKGENINEDIKSLVQMGLPEEAREAMDSLRVIGNNPVHPGERWT